MQYTMWCSCFNVEQVYQIFASTAAQELYPYLVLTVLVYLGSVNDKTMGSSARGLMFHLERMWQYNYSNMLTYQFFNILKNWSPSCQSGYEEIEI